MSKDRKKVVSVRLTEEDYARLEHLAELEEITVSTFVYQCLVGISGGEISIPISGLTEKDLENQMEKLHNHLEELKGDLLETLSQPNYPPKTEQNKKAKPKSQPSTPSAENGISARQLAKRLGCDRKTLTRWKEKGNDYLAERTRERDLDGKAWVFDEQTTMYVEADGI